MAKSRQKPASLFKTDADTLESSPLRRSDGEGTPPGFLDLLKQPEVTAPLPNDFSIADESQHLVALWQRSPELRHYRFERFIHAGGSGMVFRVRHAGTDQPLAAKLARAKLFAKSPQREANAAAGPATALSPFSPQELKALERVSHPHIVRLHATLEDSERGVYGIITSYVSRPQPLDLYLSATLQGDFPKARWKGGLLPFSPARLEAACVFLLARFQEVADALNHMHSRGLYHCDIKPANVLIDEHHTAIVTDLGACVCPSDYKDGDAIKVQFTWTYAHPDLTDLTRELHSITGGGIKVWAKVPKTFDVARVDLFALGRTIQQALGVLVEEFGEGCYASYGFRFLHLLACLMLDGHNTPLPPKDRIRKQDGRVFVSDQAMGYPLDLFASHKISTSLELADRLRRSRRDYSWNASVPELDSWHADVINTGSGGLAPFSARVEAVFTHPAVHRLKQELQLGWIKEVYPGATHTRWSHSLGVFAATADYYRALLADPEVPTARILLSADDISNGLLAAILHDIGQVGFGHDMEAAHATLYRHEDQVEKLLDDNSWPDTTTLRATIMQHWPEVTIPRVLAILRW